MQGPSIKGLALESVAAAVQNLRAQKRVSETFLEKRLAPDEIAMLDEPIVPSLWYPVGLYGRLLEILRDVEGDGRNEYLVERGAMAAERLSQVGAYRHVLQSLEKWGESSGRAMIQLASAFYNFTHWELQHEESSERYVLKVTEAMDFPDAARFTAQGFAQAIFGRMVGAPVHVTSRRTSPDCVLLEVERVA